MKSRVPAPGTNLLDQHRPLEQGTQGQGGSENLPSSFAVRAVDGQHLSCQRGEIGIHNDDTGRRALPFRLFGDLLQKATLIHDEPFVDAFADLLFFVIGLDSKDELSAVDLF